MSSHGRPTLRPSPPFRMPPARRVSPPAITSGLRRRSSPRPAGAATGSAVLTVTSAALVAIQVAPAARVYSPDLHGSSPRPASSPDGSSPGSDGGRRVVLEHAVDRDRLERGRLAAGLATGVAAWHPRRSPRRPRHGQRGHDAHGDEAACLVAIDRGADQPDRRRGGAYPFLHRDPGTFSNGAARNPGPDWPHGRQHAGGCDRLRTTPRNHGAAPPRSRPARRKITATVGTVSGGTTLTVPSELCSSGPPHLARRPA